jgi:prolipoprotein diacylglyceryltransferase
MGIWGGIALGTLAGLFVLRRRGADVARIMDAAAPALLVAQTIGRIGNWFNQELFGGPTSLPWGLRIDPANRPLGYAQHVTFQPTFLYELTGTCCWPACSCGSAAAVCARPGCSARAASGGPPLASER